MRTARSIAVALTCLTWSLGCDQQHLELGAWAPDAMAAADGRDANVPTPDDASTAGDDARVPQDAGADAHQNGPLDVRLQTLGRARVRSVQTACDVDCVDVDIIVSGGVPPYRMLFGSDYQDGPSRQRVCSADGSLVVLVEDSSPNPVQQQAGLSVTFPKCVELPSKEWQVCSWYPLLPNRCTSNPRGPYVIELDHALEPNSSVMMSLTAALSLLDVELLGGDSCVPSLTLGRVPTWGNQFLSYGPIKSAVPVTHLQLRTVGTNDGSFPLGLEPLDLTICESFATPP